MELELSKIEVGSQNTRQIRRIHTWAILLFIFSAVTGIYNLFTSYKLFKIYSRLDLMPGAVSNSFKIQSAVNILFLVLYGILLPLQAFLFFNFSKHFKQSFQNDNAQEFTTSLKWLLKQTIVGCFLFAINAIWAIINTLVINPS